MNALVIWVLLPGLAAVALYGLRRFDKSIHLAGISVCLLLAYLAWRVPIDEPIVLRLLTALPAIRIAPVAVILGGSFRLDNAARPALALLYLAAAFWFGGAYPARTHRLFVPLGLAMVALISATLGAEQTPTAALLIELAALLSVPLVSSPGKKMRQGVIRFLAYQTGGVCLILFAEATIASSSIDPAAGGGETAILNTGLFILVLGFSLLLAVVPFHTWMPMMLGEGNPYSAIFVCFVIPATIAVLVVELLFRFAATGMIPAMITVLRYGGVLMVVAGGFGAALERHLGRIAGFAALTQVGMTLLAVSLNDTVGRATPVIGIFFAQLIPQGLGLAVWGLALSILRSHIDSMDFRSALGAGRKLPVTTSALILANLSTAGMPLLASFPISVALVLQLSSRALVPALLSLVGNLGLLISGLRSLVVLVTPSELAEASPLAETEQPGQALSGALATGSIPTPPPAPTPAASPAAGSAAPGAAPNLAAAQPAADNSQGKPTLPTQPGAAAPLPAAAWQISETRLQVMMLCLGIGLILLAGLFPQAYFPTLTNMAIQFASP